MNFAKAAGLWLCASLGLGCQATATGWQRSDQRACVPDAPARVCVSANPDRAFEAQVGDVILLPGECAVAPDDTKGRLTVGFVMGDGSRDEAKAKVAPERTTQAHLGPEGVDQKLMRRPSQCEAAVWPEFKAAPGE